MGDAVRPSTPTADVVRPAVSLAAVLAACLLVLAVALMAASPRVAFAAGSYSSPKTDITMQVETDGSYRVVEYRVLDFQGDSAYVGWSFTSLAETASVQIDGMRLAQADADGNVEGDWKTLSSTSFSAKWLAGGASSGATYAYDNAEEHALCFSSGVRFSSNRRTRLHHHERGSRLQGHLRGVLDLRFPRLAGGFGKRDGDNHASCRSRRNCHPERHGACVGPWSPKRYSLG